VLAETQPAGVVLDLTDVDYVFGNAIGALAHPLLRIGPERRWKIPVAIIAVGRTATALAPLLGPIRRWASSAQSCSRIASRPWVM
jgi:hypothetical protein